MFSKNLKDKDADNVWYMIYVSIYVQPYYIDVFYRFILMQITSE